MGLDYFPLGFEKVNAFFDITGVDEEKQLDILINTLDNRFCKYRDKSSGIFCGKKTRNIIVNNCCIKHLKDLYPDIYKDYRKTHRKNYYTKKTKEDIHYCISNSVRKERCGMRVKNYGDLCERHKHKKETSFYFGIIEINKGIKENNILNNVKIEHTNNNNIPKFENQIKNEIVFGDNIKTNISTEIENKKDTPLVLQHISKEEMNNCLKKGIKIHNENKGLPIYYDLNNKKLNTDKILKIYRNNKKLEMIIKNNKKYLYLKNNNINKAWYYRENDIRNLLESTKLRFEILLEDFINTSKIYWIDLLNKYEEDIDEYILEFYNIDDKYKLFL